MFKKTAIDTGATTVRMRRSEFSGEAEVDLPPPSDRQPSVLLVDDDPHILGLQARMLKSMGYNKVTSLVSAKDALQHVQANPESADVIICDLNMPGMDGIEFLQGLNTTDVHRSVILLSGAGARIMHTVQKLLSGGSLVIIGAITKPAGRIALREMLESWGHAEELEAKGGPLPPLSTDEVRRAVEEKQWQLHYQPQVDLKTGALVGMEALVRCNTPKHGLVYPDRFINVAEECEAIFGLTDWVARQAMLQRLSWRDQGLDLRVSVNISMRSLQVPEFWRKFGALVRETGSIPQDLTLEITESQLMSTSKTPLENLVRLRLNGFALAIDDFGTGHSSLQQLRDVPFSELKIDRGFVHGARHNLIIRPMLEGSLGIARRMGLKSVAEGVETESDWELLRELECDRAQGYFIGRPMHADKIWDWLNLWQSRQAQLCES